MATAEDSIDGENTAAYRLNLGLSGLDVADEPSWQPLVGALEREIGHLGPVLSFEDGQAVVTLLSDAEGIEAAQAVSDAVTAVSRCLIAVGLGHAFVATIELEVVVELNA